MQFNPPFPLSLLRNAADPDEPLLAEAISDRETLERLGELAELHGVRPILLRKLRLWPDPGEAVAAVLERWRASSILEAGQSMLLRRHADRVLAGLEAEGIAARIVKGPSFADRLYAHAADRPFTDIDLLVRRDEMAAAGRVMAGLGFNLPMGEAPSERLLEYKWVVASNASILIELHADLVHLPGMRRRLSLDFDRLAEIDAGESDSPPSQLLIAVVHAAGGHKFHRLQLVVDVLQAVRRLRPGTDEERALEAARRSGASLEFATVLGVTGKLFDSRPAADLAERASSGFSAGIARALITPDALLEAGTAAGWQSRLRRDAFRWIQRLASA